MLSPFSDPRVSLARRIYFFRADTGQNDQGIQHDFDPAVIWLRLVSCLSGRTRGDGTNETRKAMTCVHLSAWRTTPCTVCRTELPQEEREGQTHNLERHDRIKKLYCLGQPDCHVPVPRENQLCTGYIGPRHRKTEELVQGRSPFSGPCRRVWTVLAPVRSADQARTNVTVLPAGETFFRA